MKKFCSILLFSFLVMEASSQSDTSFKLIRVIQGDIVSFTVDNLDNIYILNSRNQIKKLDSKGDSVAVYNDVKKYGTATLLDVSNPLKVLVYYKDFSTLVALDRTMNVRNTIDLRKQNILQAKAIGLSYDNKIWVYDEIENKLKKIDEEGKLLQETPDFRLLLGQSPTPVKIFDENKYVYLYDPSKGIYVFDYFGTYRNNIMIYNWNNFKVVDKYIFGSRNDTLYRYEISSFLYDEWKMPQALRSSRAFNFTSSRLYALKKDVIEIYALQ
jgi:hypothetical protein